MKPYPRTGFSTLAALFLMAGLSLPVLAMVGGLKVGLRVGGLCGLILGTLVVACGEALFVTDITANPGFLS